MIPHYPSRAAAICSLIFAASMLFSGCASLFNKGKSSVVLKSDPSGAAVFRDGTEVGTTPYQYQYEPAHGKEVIFELRMPDHQVSEVKMRPRKDGGVMFIDAMLLHIPYIIDGGSPDLYELPVNECTITLFNEIPQDLTSIALPISGAEFPSSKITGKLNGKTSITLDDELASYFRNENDRMMAIVNGCKGSYLDARFVRTGTTDGAKAIRKAKFQLKPIINSINVDLEKRNGRYYGPVQMEIDWRFYSGVTEDSVLFILPKTMNFQAVNERRGTLLINALEAAVNGLVCDAELHPKLTEAHGAGLLLAKGDVVEIHVPEPIKFDGRREMLSKLIAGVVTVVHDEGHGSGFIISNQGHIITNEHVVSGMEEIKIKLEQGITLEGEILKTNPDMDLALIKVTATDLPALLLGNDDDLLIGEEIFAIGTPMDQQLGQSVSRGILSGKRDIDGKQYLQTDVSINPGNSGGPMINENGRVVGVTTMKILGDGVEGLGFGVPINVALEMLNINMIER